MSAEESECELQQLVSSDEENVPLNNDIAIASGSNTKSYESVQRPQTLHKVASDHSYRSSKVRILVYSSLFYFAFAIINCLSRSKNIKSTCFQIVSPDFIDR